MLEKLCEAPPLGSDVFDTKQKALMFAAALGFARRKREPVDRRGTAIRFDIFQRDLDDGFIDALAVAETNDLRVLEENRADERIKIFEEYTNGGLAEMERLCFGDVAGPLESLLKVAQEASLSRDSAIPGVDANVLNLLSR